MVKKYLTMIAAAAFFAAAGIVHAPNLKALCVPQGLEKSIISGPFASLIKENQEKEKYFKRKFEQLKNYETDDFNDDTLQLLLARLIMGEDEGHKDISKIADAWTPVTRAMNYYGISLKTPVMDIMSNPKILERMRWEILNSGAYSCFNEGTDSSIFLKKPLLHAPLKYTDEFPHDMELAKDLLAGRYEDPTHGATNYFNPDGLEAWKIRFVKGLGRIKTPIDWDMDNMIFTVKIGDHYYFKEKV